MSRPAEQFATFMPIDSAAHATPLTITTIGFDYDYDGIYHAPAGTDEWLFVLFLDQTEAHLDGATVDCPPGTFLAWDPGRALHYGLRNRSFRHHWLRCVGHQVRTWYESCGLPVMTPIHLPWPDHGCDPWWQALRLECSRGPGAKAEIVAHLLRIIFMHVERSQLGSTQSAGPKTASPTAVSSGLLRAKWHIEASFRQAHGIDIDGLAAIAGLSRAHFSTRFHATFGMPPMAFCIHLRMRHAALLLANADLRIGDIAATVGYDDPFHFSKLFRKHHGLSPRRYRQRLSDTDAR